MIKQSKRLFFMLILVLMIGLLVACEEDNESTNSAPQTPIEAAQEVLTLINNTNTEAASQYLCEQDIQTLLENPPTDATPKFSSISCVGNEAIVTCTYNIEIGGRTAERGLTAEFDVDEDGKLCAATAE